MQSKISNIHFIRTAPELTDGLLNQDNEPLTAIVLLDNGYAIRAIQENPSQDPTIHRYSDVKNGEETFTLTALKPGKGLILELTNIGKLIGSNPRNEITGQKYEDILQCIRTIEEDLPPIIDPVLFTVIAARNAAEHGAPYNPTQLNNIPVNLQTAQPTHHTPTPFEPA